MVLLVCYLIHRMNSKVDRWMFVSHQPAPTDSDTWACSPHTSVKRDTIDVLIQHPECRRWVWQLEQTASVFDVMCWEMNQSYQRIAQSPIWVQFLTYRPMNWHNTVFCLSSRWQPLSAVLHVCPTDFEHWTFVMILLQQMIYSNVWHAINNNIETYDCTTLFQILQ